MTMKKQKVPVDRPDQDQFFRLPELSAYTGWSIPTLRRYIADPVRPLPHHHICRAGKTRGIILVSRREVDDWMQTFPPTTKRDAATAN